MNIRRKIATAAFTGVLLVGGAAPALAGGGHGGPGPKPDKPVVHPLPDIDCPANTNIVFVKGGYVCRPVKPPFSKPCPDHKGGHHGPKCPDFKHGKGHSRPVKPTRPAQKRPVQARHYTTGAAAAMYGIGGTLLAATGGTVLVAKKRRNG